MIENNELLAEYLLAESLLESNFYKHLHKLRLDYINRIAEFNVGDFIGNVTGIIKVEHIGYNMIFDKPEIVYYGYRYKKNKGVLSRTKDKNIATLSCSLKLIEYDEIQ